MSTSSGRSAAASSSSSSSSLPSGGSSAAFLSPLAAFAGRCCQSVQAYLTAHQDQLKWRIPLGLTILYLAHRRIARTRQALFAGRREDFWRASLLPPHAAPADSLAKHLQGTHLTYSLLPLGVQHWLRDHGGFRTMADYGIWIGGALAFGWRPRMLRRMFGAREGRAFDVRYAEGERHTLDVTATHRYTTPTSTQQKKDAGSSSGAPVSALSPVLIWVHGGAWGSGDKLFYRALTQQFDEQLGFVTFTINYRVYPDATADGQIDDVAKAVAWTHANCEQFGGDPKRIYLMGHSSGVHILSLYLLKQLATHGALSVPLVGAIGLSGVYDIGDHYEFESARGVMEISPMKAACGNNPADFTAYSATGTAMQLTSAQRANLPPFLLLHGETDDTVPPSSTIRFGYALAGGFDKIPVPLPTLPSHSTYHAPESDSADGRLRAFTFPRSPSAPLVHVRIVGAETDPSQCDHASFIFDILHTRTNRNADGDREITTVGHTKWIMESLAAFRDAAEQQAKQTMTPATNDTSVPLAHTNSSAPLRAHL